jgi:hypothetical protein
VPYAYLTFIAQNEATGCQGSFAYEIPGGAIGKFNPRMGVAQRVEDGDKLEVAFHGFAADR